MMENEAFLETLVLEFQQEEGYLEVSLNDFKLLYNEIINNQLLDDYTVFAYFLEEKVIIIFPEKEKLILCVNHEDKILTRDDFNFVSTFQSYGTFEGKYKFTTFLVDEIKLNGIKFIVVFSSFLLFFYYAYSDEFIRVINTLILTSITIFISIFLLFITKKDLVEKNVDLLKENYFYKLMETDKHILSISIYVVLLSIFNVGLTYITEEKIKTVFTFCSDINFNSVYFPDINVQHLVCFKCLVIALLSSLNLVLLMECYASIVQYYFEREKYLQLIPASKKLLENEIERYNEMKE